MAGAGEIGERNLLAEAQAFVNALPDRHHGIAVVAPPVGAIVAKMEMHAPPLPAQTAATMLGLPGNVALLTINSMRSQVT